MRAEGAGADLGSATPLNPARPLCPQSYLHSCCSGCSGCCHHHRVPAHGEGRERGGVGRRKSLFIEPEAEQTSLGLLFPKPSPSRQMTDRTGAGWGGVHSSAVCVTCSCRNPRTVKGMKGRGLNPPSQKAHFQGGTETGSPLHCPQHPHPDGDLCHHPAAHPNGCSPLTLTFLAELPEQVFGWLCRGKRMGTQRSLATAVPGPAPKPQRHQPITSSKSTRDCP